MFCKFGHDRDKFELLASYGTNPVAILANASSEHELIALDDIDMLSDVRSDLQVRGFAFIGVVAFMGDTVQFALSEPEDDDEGGLDNLYTLATSYMRFVDERKRAQSALGDSLPFLEALWTLHDPRPQA